jgi:hypothetical protein
MTYSYTTISGKTVRITSDDAGNEITREYYPSPFPPAVLNVLNKLEKRETRMRLAEAYMNQQLTGAQLRSWRNDLRVTGTTTTSWMLDAYLSGTGELLLWLAAASNGFMSKTYATTERRDALLLILND